MRKLLVLLCLAWMVQAHAQISIYDCSLYEGFEITQTELGGSDLIFHRPCVVLDQTYDFGGDFKKYVHANTSIDIISGAHSGFDSGFYDSVGVMDLQIVPKADFDVAVMNYPSLGGVLKYEKLELGVELPANVLEKVNNFVGDSLVDDSLKINPYLEWELQVTAYFLKGSDTISIDGFYSRDFTSAMVSSLPVPANAATTSNSCYSDEEYIELGSWTALPSSYPFRIRFAPPQTGVWDCFIKIKINSTITYTSDVFAFNVVESGNPGYVKADAGERFLSWNNRTFIPIGCNVPWPITTASSDPELFEYMTGEGFIRNEDYRNYYVVPRVYDRYRQTMSDLADSGANYIRTIMYPTGTEIEWEELGNYTGRLHMAQEMDKIIELAEEKDFFLHWNMQIHYSFQYSDAAYDKLWTWEYQKLDGTKFCYRELMAPDNPTDSPVNFFSHEESKKYYKQRLRYILARYGYSTGIGALELFSEISNVGNATADDNSYYMEDTNYIAYSQWQVEMANYIKTQYHGQVHLVTANYVGAKHKDDLTFIYPSMDVMTSNIYDFREPGFTDEFYNKVADKYLNDDCYDYPDVAGYSTHCYPTIRSIKPMIFSETGPVEIELACPESYIEMNRSMWLSLFCGLAGALDWQFVSQPQNYGALAPMRNFMSQFEYLGDENWHPGASEYEDLNGEPLWKYNGDWADDMEGELANLQYLRSGDGNYAIGVITNKTFNGSNQAGVCMQTLWDVSLSALAFPEEVNSDDQGLRLRGMHNDRYYINYFFPSDLSNPIHSTDDVGPRVKLDVDIPGTEDGYIVLFMARRDNHSWIDQNNSSNMTNQPTGYSTYDSIAGNYNGQSGNLIKVYPVPSTDMVRIEANVSDGPILIDIQTIDGKTKNEIIMSTGNIDIDISSFQRGTYLIRFNQYGRLIATKKIIKL